MEQVLPGFGSIFVAVALFFFAFTTVLAYYYIAETNVAYLTRNLRSGSADLHPAGGADRLGAVWLRAHQRSGVGSGRHRRRRVMAWLNIFAILVLQKPALLALKDYEAQQAQGRLEPQFDPRPLGIENAGPLVKIADRRKREG